MQTLLQLASETKPETQAVLSNAGENVDLAVNWNHTGSEFLSSLRALFTGPRPPRDEELPADRVLRAHWIRGRIPGRGFFASLVWHIAAIWILTLPIWEFLPKPLATLPPVEIELTYYPPVDLPPISLPATPKPSPAPSREQPKPAPEIPERAQDETTPARQRIISIPVRITHPRQTLIEPHAPDKPPKVAPQLPNIVEWPSQEPVKPRLEFTTTASAPKARDRVVRDVDAPELLPSEKNAGPMNIASQAPVKLEPQMTVPAMAARATTRHAPSQPDATAPDAPLARGTEPQALIALSATPSPPAPSVAMPEGNLAARIVVSPDGTKPGTGASKSGSNSANAGAEGATGGNGAAGAAGSLPASIYVGPGKQPAEESSGIGVKPLDLNVRASNARPAPPASAPHADVPRPRVIQPGEPPEKILSGKEVYTLHLNLPNLTSSRGSWVLSFAELDEGEGLPPSARLGKLSGPAPLETVDPKYPQTMIDQHVHGEVVLYAIIRKDGSVDSIQLVESLDPVLDKNAIRALGLWKFQPGKRGGVAVDLEAVVYIPFEYRNLLP